MPVTKTRTVANLLRGQRTAQIVKMFVSSMGIVSEESRRLNKEFQA